MIPFAASGDVLPLEGETPWPPVETALDMENLSYDDGSLSVRIEKEIAFDTNVYYVYVSITDPSQLRTALSAPYPSKQWTTAATIAKRNNAVLAINGDFFTYHTSGYAVRQGKLLRNVPVSSRDTLIIDENADLTIIDHSSSKNIEAFPREIRQAFCFGPGLIIDGEVAKFKYADKTSCGYPTKAQRMIFCQLGPMSYLFFATEGPEQNQPGLTIPECMTLLEGRGIQQAYNLDGGNSTSIILCGTKINAADAKVRDIGDIIYFATTVAP